MNATNSSPDRRADLDALRAVAMLLGIVLHASLSFFPSYWAVVDRRQNDAFGVLFSAIHGFRMPVFFVMSGYFSAMLLERRGRWPLVKHRFRRVFLPMLLGTFTIVPLTNWVSSRALAKAPRQGEVVTPTAETTSIWAAAGSGDVAAIEKYLAQGSSINGTEGDFGITPLHRAALANRVKAAELLLRRGADVNIAANDGGTPLHAAAFVGNPEVVATLVEHGANVNAANKRGETPLDNASVDVGTTLFFAALLEIPIQQDGLEGRKAAVVDFLRDHGARAGRQYGLADLLMAIPIFNHLWFLWFLWWLVVGLVVVSALGSLLPWPRLPAWLVNAPVRYLWLVPLTMIPQWYMGEGGATPIFGPDTSIGFLPIPHVLAYYAIFFGFGALYFDREDRVNTGPGRWWLPLGIALAVVFPLGMALLNGWPAPLGAAVNGLDPRVRRVLAVAMVATYPWLMTFGLMGCFRRLFPVENATMRYLSDSAYWLYLAHLPLVIAAQLFVRDWPLPSWLKFGLIVVVVTGFLLGTYQLLVRYSWLGRFLNGPRVRPARGSAASAAA